MHKLLLKLGEYKITHCFIDDKIFEDYIQKFKKLMPVDMYLKKEVTGNDIEEVSDGISGAIRYISLLSCIDGLILMDNSLNVQGFGSVITCEEEPRSVYLARDSFGTFEKLSKIDPNHFGTRHRSMMRYCNKYEDSIGFVISQDGDVRVITKIDEKLLIWENIKLKPIR